MKNLKFSFETFVINTEYTSLTVAKFSELFYLTTLGDN
jgi:hypothetical protein